MAPARRSADETAALRISLLAHAARLVRRDGAQSLTMRGLAAEAGCAVGLPYKVFAGRDQLVATLIDEQFRRLGIALAELVASAGIGTVGGNLGRFAEILLGSESEVVKLAGEISVPHVAEQVETSALSSGFTEALGTCVARYVAAEKRLGRVDPDVDEDAINFLVTGAVHNLLVSGAAYPRPSPEQVTRMLGSLATLLQRDRPAGRG